jgi:hypothetical protein
MPSKWTTSRRHERPANRAWVSLMRPRTGLGSETATRICNWTQACCQTRGIVRTLPLRGERCSDVLADIKPTDQNITDNFYASLPPSLRHALCHRYSTLGTVHELTRAASAAIVLLNRSQNTQFSVVTGEVQVELAQAAAAYFDKAVTALATPIPLEARLAAVLDLYNFRVRPSGSRLLCRAADLLL